MLNKVLSELLNRQFIAELRSAYLYLAFANYFDHRGLDGFANWYEVQAREELDHAMFISRYMGEQGESVSFDMIDEVSTDDMGMLDVLKEAKAHEELVTDMINRIYQEAVKLNDFRTLSFLGWFVKEQAEEEKNAADMVQKYATFGLCSSCGDCCVSYNGTDFNMCGSGLYALNHELACRSYSAPEYPLG